MSFATAEFLNLTRSLNWKTEVLDKFAEFLALDQDDSAVDLGCGTGHFTQLLANHGKGCELIGVDLQENLVVAAAAQSTQSGVKTRPNFCVADATRLPFASNQFDLVVSHYLYVDCSEPIDLLKEAVRVAKPGGTVATLEPIFQIDQLNCYQAGLSPEQQENLVEIYRKVLVEIPSRTGTDRTITPRLPSLFEESGLEEVQVETEAAYNLSSQIDGEQLTTYQQVAKKALDAIESDATKMRDAHLLKYLTDEELALLVSIQKRQLKLIVNDPDAFQKENNFTSATFLFIKGRKTAGQ